MDSDCTLDTCARCHPPNVLTLCCEPANARPAPRGAAVAAFDLTRLQPPRRRTKSAAAAGSAGGTATAARQHLRRVRRARFEDTTAIRRHFDSLHSKTSPAHRGYPPSTPALTAAQSLRVAI